MYSYKKRIAQKNPENKDESIYEFTFYFKNKTKQRVKLKGKVFDDRFKTAIYNDDKCCWFGDLLVFLGDVTAIRERVVKKCK